MEVDLVSVGGTPEPPDLGDLAARAREEGLAFVDRTVLEWRDGTNRFDGPGEWFFVARDTESLVGMCGLNCDPFVGDPSVGRLRHLYVSPSARRAGVGRALVGACITAASGRFARVRLRTFDRSAAEFYETLGFTPIDEAEATHTFEVGDGVAGRSAPLAGLRAPIRILPIRSTRRPTALGGGQITIRR